MTSDPRYLSVMPFWRPEPFTSLTVSEGKPSPRSSVRMGSNDS